jgi:hypothetical protein
MQSQYPQLAHGEEVEQHDGNDDFAGMSVLSMQQTGVPV